MKITTLAAGAALALTAVIGGAALAQTADRPSHSLRADADGDGRISRAEFVDGRLDRLSATDANRDGQVSVEERRSGIDTRRNQRMSSRFETLDRDGDGSLSREEFMTGRQGRGPAAGRPGQDAVRGMGPHRGGRSGRASERAQARGPISLAEVRGRLTARFDRLDASRDGYLSAEELRAGRDAMRNRHGGRGPDRQPSPPATASE
jgi:hypothetical protein